MCERKRMAREQGKTGKMVVSQVPEKQKPNRVQIETALSLSFLRRSFFPRQSLRSFVILRTNYKKTKRMIAPRHAFGFILSRPSQVTSEICGSSPNRKAEAPESPEFLPVN
jgi:hypothetical protein